MPAQTQTRVQGAVWTSAFVDALPNSSFAFVSEDGKTRKLPYKDKDGKVDLPHVRNALARLNQTQGIPDDEKEAIRTKLLGALNNAKAADDTIMRQFSAIQADSFTADTLPDRVHLLRDGEFNTAKYGEIPIKAADLYEMKFNFDRGVGMAHEGETGIPIDFAHQSHLNAAGWIRNLEVIIDAEDGTTELWGTNVEWSDSGKSALLGKEYKCISSDFYPAAFGEWIDPESGVVAKNVIVGAGLTNRPLMTGNHPVIASEEAEASGVKTVIYVNASENKKETSMNLDELIVKDPADLTGPEALHIAAHASELSQDVRKKFGLEAASESEEDKKKKEAEAKAASEKEAAIKAAQDAGGVQAAELKAANDKIAALTASVEALTGNQKASEHEKIQKEVEAHAGRGAIKPDQIETFVTALEAADEETAKGLRASLAALSSNPLLGKTFGSSKTEGSAELDGIENEIMKKANELVAAAHAKGDKLNIFDARKQVLASDQSLEQKANGAVQAAGTFDPYQGAWGTNAAGLQGVNPEALKR